MIPRPRVTRLSTSESPAAYRALRSHGKATGKYENVYTGETISRREFQVRTGRPLGEGWTRTGPSAVQQGRGDYLQYGQRGAYQPEGWRKPLVDKQALGALRRRLGRLARANPDQILQVALGADWIQTSDGRTVRGWQSELQTADLALAYAKQADSLHDFAELFMHGGAEAHVFYAFALREVR